jgi:hypothetical protein
MRATLFALFYGDYFPYHSRLLSSLARFVPRESVDVRLWFNVVSDQTRKYARGLGFPFFDCHENIPKHIAMRKLFYPGPENPFGEIKTPFLIWFDDDSHITAPDWWDRTVRFIEAHQHENLCYLGQLWEMQWFPGQWFFVRQQPWFKGIPPFPVGGRPGVVFACGAYFWIRTDVLFNLNWPDPRLQHNGGDYLLAEAIRQQGFPFHRFDYGVEVNDAPRRGLNEVPLGSNAELYESPKRRRPYTWIA